MRLTIYEHFVAGTDKTELKPIVQRLRQHGVKLILDYSMESDISSNKQFVKDEFHRSVVSEFHFIYI